MVISIVQKIITFALNQVMVLSTSPEVLGQAAVQLELLLSTLLFLSREGIRLSTLRQSTGSSASFQSVVNISWLPPLLVLVLSALISLLRDYFAPNYDCTVVYMYSAAAFIECLGEPLYNMFQNVANIKPRLSAETTAVFTKSVVTVLCVAYWDLGVHGFGIAQLAYAITYVLVLCYHCLVAVRNKEVQFTGSALCCKDLLPRLIYTTNIKTGDTTNSLFGGNVLSVAATLTGSSLLKHLLTESDKIALTLSASTYNQGIYAVTNNYGSLAARVIYLPLEDSARLAFAKLSGDFKQSAQQLLPVQNNATEEKPTATGQARSIIATTQNDKEGRALQTSDCTDRLLLLKNTLTRLLRLVGFIGLFFALFGIPYVPVAVQYVLGAKWRTEETISALRTYCIYLLVMGVNGVAESFVQTAAPASAFTTLNIGLILSSLGFVAVAIPAVRRFGTSGIILANSFGMVVRIANNGAYTLKMFANPALFFDRVSVSNETRPVAVNDAQAGDGLTGVTKKDLVKEVSPPLLWVVCVLASAAVVHASAYWYAHTSRTIAHTAMHVLVGGTTAVVFLLTSLYFAPEQDVTVVVDRFPLSLQRRFRKSKQL